MNNRILSFLHIGSRENDDIRTRTLLTNETNTIFLNLESRYVYERTECV